MIILDKDGYPTAEYLEFIRTYNPKDMPIMVFIETILKRGWWMPEWGFILRRKYGDHRSLELHTGGWSGNEEIIMAMKGNIYLIHHPMKFKQWRAGGHFYFEISLK